MIRQQKKAAYASDREAQYDERAKRVAGSKIVIASILSKTVDAFRGMKPREIVPYIEGEPYIGSVPVEPGQTNASYTENGKRIVGFNTENQEENEGLVRFDVICYVRLPEKESKAAAGNGRAARAKCRATVSGRKGPLTQIIINIEIQKDQPHTYKILNRAVFYVSRQISSQKERDFVKSHYDDIKSVYSIWICMNMEENSLCHIHLTKEDIIGNKQWGGNLKLFNIIMIGIGKKLPEHTEIYELHRLLGTLFSKDLGRKDKIGILKEEYDITEDDNLREDVSEMCNLSQGIKEDGIAIGLEKGREDGIAIGRKDGIAIGRKDGIAIGETGLIQNMHKNGFTAEQIAAATDKDLEDVKAILRNK